MAPVALRVKNVRTVRAYAEKPSEQSRHPKYNIKMKTKLSLEGFSEISRAKQQEINGGGLLLGLLASLLVAGGTEIIQDWDNFKNGLMGRPEEK